jgi:MraZ protein
LYRKSKVPAKNILLFFEECLTSKNFSHKIEKKGFRWFFVPDSGCELLKGQYNITLDEKGRIVFPCRLRSGISDATVMVTYGYDQCLWIFSRIDWQDFSAKVTKSASRLNEKTLAVLRHFIAPAQEVEFDRNGRLSIPQSLREYAGLSKDCVIHGIKTLALELWDIAVYKAYQEKSDALFREAMETVTIDI